MGFFEALFKKCRGSEHTHDYFTVSFYEALCCRNAVLKCSGPYLYTNLLLKVKHTLSKIYRQNGVEHVKRSASILLPGGLL